MAWGTNKFTKKLLRPNAVNNNELADFISRVPDNEELVKIDRLKVHLNFLASQTRQTQLVITPGCVGECAENLSLKFSVLPDKRTSSL